VQRAAWQGRYQSALTTPRQRPQVVRLQEGAGVEVLHHYFRTAPARPTAEALALTGTSDVPDGDQHRTTGGPARRGVKTFHGKTYHGSKRPAGQSRYAGAKAGAKAGQKKSGYQAGPKKAASH